MATMNDPIGTSTDPTHNEEPRGASGEGFSYEEKEFLNDLVFNALYHRREIMQKVSHQKRDLFQETGWHETSELNAEMYYDLYQRFDIATRVVDMPVEESWRREPVIIETDDEAETTPFEKAWADLDHRLGYPAEENYHRDDSGSVIWEALKRADKLSRIGHYGIIVLELDDVDGEVVKWSDPAPGFEGMDDEGRGVFGASVLNSHRPRTTRPEGTELLGLRCFDETNASITQWYDSGPLQGRPRMYQVTLYDTATDQTGTTKGVQQRNVDIHWTRVIHISDGLMHSDFIGTPAMQPVVNEIQDLRKIFGASGEGYWRMAFPFLSFESHPNLGSKAVLDKESLREEVEKAKNTLERYMATVGGTWKTIAGEVTDPTPHINQRVEAICVYLGCPVRIFKGSERGEVASSQDKDSWDERMILRQRTYITPRIISPFINRLITVGVLPVPAEGFRVEWPDLTTLSLQAKATWAVTQVNAIIKYVSGGGDFLLAPSDFLTRVLGFNQRDADQILKSVEAHLSETSGDDEVVGRSPMVRTLEQERDIIEKKEGNRTVQGTSDQKAVSAPVE